MSTVYIIHVPLKIDLRSLDQDDCCFLSNQRRPLLQSSPVGH